MSRRFKRVLLVLVLCFFTRNALARRLAPEEIEIIREGNRACEQGNYEAGIFAYQKAFTKFNSADAAFNLGITYEVDLKDRVQAVYYYKKFVQLKPESEDARHVRQWINELQLYLDNRPAEQKEPPLNTERPKPARKQAKPRSLEALDTESAQTAKQHLKQGNLAAIQGNYGQAIEEYEKVLNFYDSSDVYYNLGVIYSQKLKQNAKALKYYEKFIQLEPNSPQVLEIKIWMEKQKRSSK